MDFVFTRSYRGPLRGIILDWAGTTVDYGCFAPTAVVLRVFASRGVPITTAQARAPMGLMKKDHLRAVAQMEPVSRRWQEVHGRPWAEADLEAMFQEFVPTQIACLLDYADLIPGTLEAVAEFRRRGLKIGSTTGYTREMMEVLVPAVQQRGYTPDAWVCPSDVPAGRPFPWMAYLNAMRLRVYPLEAFVKIGDTLPDIEEGLNAGMWTVGLTLSGNELGLSRAEAEALDEATRAAKREEIGVRMRRAGAHYVVDGIWQCGPLLDDINARLARGERPLTRLRVDQALRIGYTVPTQRSPLDGVLVDENEVTTPQDMGAAEVPSAGVWPDDEDALVEQAKHDKEAFGLLYERYVDKIFSYIYYRTSSRTDAEDLTSRVFHRALDHIKDYENRGVPFSAWLYRIAHNLVANWHCDEGRRKAVPLDEVSDVAQRRPSPDRQIEADEEVALLRQAIQELPPDRQELLVLKFEAQLPNAQIGQIMGRSEGAVKSLYHRTLIALREELKSRGL